MKYIQPNPTDFRKLFNSTEHRTRTTNGDVKPSQNNRVAAATLESKLGHLPLGCSTQATEVTTTLHYNILSYTQPSKLLISREFYRMRTSELIIYL